MTPVSPQFDDIFYEFRIFKGISISKTGPQIKITIVTNFFNHHTFDKNTTFYGEFLYVSIIPKLLNYFLLYE